MFENRHFGLIYNHILDPQFRHSFGPHVGKGKIRDTVIETEAKYAGRKIRK